MNGNTIGGIILIGLGGAFLAHNFGFLSLASLWKFWPVILIALGVSMIFAKK